MGKHVKYPYVTNTKTLDTVQTRPLDRGDAYDDNNCKDDQYRFYEPHQVLDAKSAVLTDRPPVTQRLALKGY